VPGKPGGKIIAPQNSLAFPTPAGNFPATKFVLDFIGSTTSIFSTSDKETDMTKKTLLVALAIVLFPAMAAFAGMGYTMKCSNCGYSSAVQMGGGMRFEQITGFCVDSMKFVYLQWNRGEKKPEPVAQVWDSASGKKIDLYKCPDCPKPFMPLQATQADAEGPGFNHCPKCGKPTFQVDKGKGIIAFD
jgi:DNA-directed RNA polymerase subunit RPC12/RpoP